MTAPAWEAAKLYPNGSIVQPQSAPPVVVTAIVNPSFEDGDSDWDKDAGWTIVNGEDAFAGTWSARWDLTGVGDLTADVHIPVTPGQSITAQLRVQQGASSAGEAGAQVALAWFDSGDVEISESAGSLIDSGSSGTWQTSSVTGVAPAGAAFVAARAKGFRDGGSDPLWVDLFTWNYVAPAGTGGLVYKAVQPTTGASGAAEPTWPTTVGVQVVDNDVIWEAIAATRVEWTAFPILVSGGTEPAWPLLPGGTVVDGSLIWTAVTRRIEDENCPQTKVVAIIASHVFAVDIDIVRFCAAINPLDWTSPSDAGFLPTGLQQANANFMAVLGTYRKNLVPMNASVLQLWAMDPDPELMQPIDQMDGIGSLYHKAFCSVADDAFYLAALGVRSVAMSGAARNLSSGDVGMPIDDLVQAALAAAIADGIEPISTYYPSLGQYMLAFARAASEGGWEPISPANLDYTFVPDGDAVLEDGIVSYVGAAGNGDWTLQTPDGETLLRVTHIAFETDVNGDDALFRWDIGAGDTDTQPNTSEVPNFAFDVTPFEATVVNDEFATVGGLEFDLPLEVTAAYQFLIEVFVPGPEEPANTEVFVYTRSKVGNTGSWSRYEFPYEITEFALRDNLLYLRHGDVIGVFDPAVVYDELSVGGDLVNFPGYVQWNYLDCGQAGSTKQMQGFDFVGTGVPSVSVGYDERNFSLFTTPYEIDPDTLVGGMIPLDVWGPSLSLRVDFEAGTSWSLSSVILYVNDMGNGP